MKLSIQSLIVIAIFVPLANVEGRAKRDADRGRGIAIGGAVGGVTCNLDGVVKKTCKECGKDEWSCDGSTDCHLQKGWVWNECVDTPSGIAPPDWVNCNHSGLKARSCKHCYAEKSTCHSVDCIFTEGWVFDECGDKDHFDR